jgi:light-regulated signal transduction histidine kinase (bacteriophytochrome)
LAGLWRATSQKRPLNGSAPDVGDAERSDMALENFAHVVSHDLSEPLATVALFAQTLEYRYSDSLGVEGRRYVERIIETVDGMDERIRVLIAQARAQGEAPQPVQVDSGAAVHDALAALTGSITSSAAQVSVGALPTVIGDPVQLQRLFENLISNAIKFRRDGTPPRVTISAERKGGEWCFAVADDGIGIAVADSGRIFEIFQRVNTSLPGAGIGLAVCRQIVYQHRGRIWVDSQLGTGSTFRFTIPADG